MRQDETCATVDYKHEIGQNLRYHRDQRHHNVKCINRVLQMAEVPQQTQQEVIGN